LYISYQLEVSHVNLLSQYLFIKMQIWCQYARVVQIYFSEYDAFCYNLINFRFMFICKSLHYCKKIIIIMGEPNFYDSCVWINPNTCFVSLWKLNALHYCSLRVAARDYNWKQSRRATAELELLLGQGISLQVSASKLLWSKHQQNWRLGFSPTHTKREDLGG